MTAPTPTTMTPGHDSMPHHMIAEKVWAGTCYHYPHIERLLADLSRLRAEVEAARKIARRAVVHLESCPENCLGQDSTCGYFYRDEIINHLSSIFLTTPPGGEGGGATP